MAVGNSATVACRFLFWSRPSNYQSTKRTCAAKGAIAVIRAHILLLKHAVVTSALVESTLDCTACTQSRKRSVTPQNRKGERARLVRSDESSECDLVGAGANTFSDQLSREGESGPRNRSQHRGERARHFPRRLTHESQNAARAWLPNLR